MLNMKLKHQWRNRRVESLLPLILLLHVVSYVNSIRRPRPPRPEIFNDFTRRANSDEFNNGPNAVIAHYDDDDDHTADMSETTETRRTTISSTHSPIRIYFETSTLALQASTTSADYLKYQTLVNTVLPNISKTWSDALSVIPVSATNGGLKFPPGYRACFDTMDIPADWTTGNGLTDYDIVIFVGWFNEIGGHTLCTPGNLAAANACNLDHRKRPVVGLVNICLDTINIDPITNTISDQQKKELEDVMIHEVGHIFGMNSSFFKNFRDAATGELLLTEVERTRRDRIRCVNDNDPQYFTGVPSSRVLHYKEEEWNNGKVKGYYEVVTPTVRQVVRNQFDCQIASGARLENQPTNPSDCIGSHFDERFFFTEFMSAFYDDDTAYFSPVTLALLEDSGHYKVNYDYARNSPFGIGAGCGFVNDACIKNGKVPDYGKGFFCDDVTSYTPSSPYTFGESPWSCGPSHHFRAHCDLFQQTSRVALPYFENKNVGPFYFIYADQCPLLSAVNDIECDDMSASKLHPIEEFGADSRCMDATVTSGGRNKNSALCLRGSCNESTQSFDFHVGDTTYSCDEDFEVIVVINGGETYQFECPRIAQMCPQMFCPSMCSGKGTCDWTKSKPVCTCFDPSDTTPNCNESDPVSPDFFPDYAGTVYNGDSGSRTTVNIGFGLSISLCLLWLCSY